MSQQTKPLCLLALDGGGVRGYSELVILEHIMLGIQKHERLESLPKPCERFDMICGTSTGGIIALMLGRLKMSIQDTQDAYSRLSSEVFGKPKGPKITEGRYSAKNFEKILKRAIEQYGAAGTELKLIPGDCGATECKVFVCCQSALAIDTPRLFQSYQSFSAGQYKDLKIWEAARATSAAPTFFKRIKIGPPGAQEEFIDGGVGNNNPIKLLMEETHKAFDNQHPVACMISIGTGSTDITESKEPGLTQKVVPTQLIKALSEIATDCERVEKEVAQRFARKPGIYFRFNVEHGLERIPMEAHNELGNIRSKTINYLQDGKIRQEVDDAVFALCNPSDRIKASELWYSFPSSTETFNDTQTLEGKNAHEAFIESLDFEGRCDREDQIWNIQAQPQTVEWIWNSSFGSWASSNESLFWICGKPGSGKSTIMESTARSANLKEYLKRGFNEQWTVLRHFFFESGVSKDVRNNFEGFLRSLLYQLLKNVGQTQEVTLSGSKKKKGWSVRELKEALSNVLKQRSGPVCILIDGLDEYQDDKWDLVKFLQEIAEPQIKLCIASRPDPVFDTVFKSVQQIKMQEKNKRAIQRMVENTLQVPGFHSDDQCVELAEGISEKANGVFLWARFAVKELRTGWAEGDEFEELQSRLEGIPEELEDIYTRILKKIKPKDRQRAASMLQLVCYAKQRLTVPELFQALMQTDNEGTSPTTKKEAHAVQYPQGKYEKQVLALTGGLLDVFRKINTRMLEFQTEATSENTTHEHDQVNIIHRTVRTYLECGGWKNVLGRAHEGTLHAQMLWLRVCATLFPLSFDVPSPKAEFIPKRIKPKDMPNTSPTFKTRDYTSQKPENKRLTVPGPVVSLRRYAARFMLAHAKRVEKDLGLSSYTVLKTGLTDNFFYHHYHPDGGVSCLCSLYCPKPLHPLHVAIGHGLDGFVKDFLSSLCKTTLQGSSEWDDVFYVHYDRPLSTIDVFVGPINIPHRISLLEFAIWQLDWIYQDSISQMQIINTILERCPRIGDAEMVLALHRSAPKVVPILLDYWLARDMVFDMESMRCDVYFKHEISKKCFADKCLQKSNTRPLWHIARRWFTDGYQDEELLEIFLKRGENINGQCGPVGTALHGSLLHLLMGHFPIGKCMLLVEKGADVNAHGPLGKPLEIVWRISLESDRQRVSLSAARECLRAIRWLIDCGAVNEQQDPNGSVPSKEQMLAFRHADPMLLEKYLEDEFESS